MPVSRTDRSGSSGSARHKRGERSRNNVTQACINCRQRKKKCDGVTPICGTCSSFKDDCAWGDEDRRKPLSRGEARALRSRVEELEALVETYRHQLQNTRTHKQEATARTDLRLHGPTSAFHFADADEAPPTHPAAGWARFLPDVYLTKEQHDTAIDRFMRYYCAFGQRATPRLFYRDMEVALTIPEQVIPVQAPNYSPVLHNVIISLGLAYAKEDHLKALVTRRAFFDEANRRLPSELAAPSLATVQALALRSSFSSTSGDYSVGWINNGLATRLCYALGLHVDTAPLVKSGKLSLEAYRQRCVTFWSCFCQEEMWAIYIGRTPLMGNYQNVPMPVADPETDNEMWTWPAGPMRSAPPQICNISLVFVHTTKLLRIATEVTNTIYDGRMAKSALVTDGTIMRFSDQLDGWLEQVPDVLKPDFDPEVPTLPHVILLHLTCAWCAILLFQPFSHIVSTEDFGKYAMTRCHAAALKIDQLATIYNKQHGVQNSTSTLAQIIYTAGTTFLLAAAQAQLPSHAAAALEKVHASLDMLKAIGETWNASNHKATILQKLLGAYGQASIEAPVISDHIALWSGEEVAAMPSSDGISQPAPAVAEIPPSVDVGWAGDGSLDEFIQSLFSQSTLPLGGDADLMGMLQWPAE